MDAPLDHPFPEAPDPDPSRGCGGPGDAAGRRVLRPRSPEDLLAVVPYRLGFHPRDSVVALSLHGPRRRFGFTARLDLPSPSQVPDVARYLVRVLEHHGADEVLLVAYADDDTAPGLLVRTLQQWLERTPISLLDAYRADGRRWYCYTCDQPCCPDEGTPYDLSGHPLVAEQVLLGQVALPDREELRAQVAPVSGARRAAMQSAFERAEERLSEEMACPDLDRTAFVRAGVAWVREFVAARLAEPRPVTDDEAAELAVRVAMVPARDTAWSMMSRPAATRHRELWEQVLTRAVPPYEPAVACLTAFAAWLQGHGALAWCAVDRALAADPDYSWASLIVDLLQGAVPPSAWQPVPLEEIERFAS